MVLLEGSTRELLGSREFPRQGVSTPCGSWRRLQSSGADHRPVLTPYPDSNFIVHPTVKPAGNYLALHVVKVSHHPLSRRVDRVAALRKGDSSAFNPWLGPGFGRHESLRAWSALWLECDAFVMLLIVCAEIGVDRRGHYRVPKTLSVVSCLVTCQSLSLLNRVPDCSR